MTSIEPSDIYVAIEASSKKAALALFMANYLQGYLPSSDYYEYPQFGKTETEFETDDYETMMHYVLSKRKAPFNFYFNDPENKEVSDVMIFFNKDDSLVLGLAVRARYVAKYERRLKEEFDNPLMLTWGPTLPPNNLEDFKKEVGDFI